MVDASLRITNPQHAPLLLGTEDAVLRRLRRLLGIEIVYRNDMVTLRGDDEAVARGLAILHELLAFVSREGRLEEDDVSRIVGRLLAPTGAGADDGSPEPAPDPAAVSPIDIFEKGRKVHPRSAGQKAYVEAIRHHDLVFCAGPAGSGKTYLAVAMALNFLRSERIRKIVLVRPAVEAGEKLGFLPGDMIAKVNPFLRPLLDALQDLLDYEQVKRYMETDIIEILPLAFMRGRTLNGAFMILDEAQNTTVTQMQMFLTRMGEGSKIVVTGDTTQIDLPPNVTCGLTDAIGRLRSIEGIASIRLAGEDIVRHRLVRDIVKAYEDAVPQASARSREAGATAAAASGPEPADATSSTNHSSSEDPNPPHAKAEDGSEGAAETS